MIFKTCLIPQKKQSQIHFIYSSRKKCCEVKETDILYFMASPCAVKAQYINPFLNSTQKLFDATFNINPSAGNCFLVKNQVKHRWEISGVMILTGSAIGIVSIRLTRHLSLKLLEKSGISYDSIEERTS